jgi:hypothetical protein
MRTPKPGKLTEAGKRWEQLQAEYSRMAAEHHENTPEHRPIPEGEPWQTK